MRSLVASFHFAPPVDVVRCALTKGFTSGEIGLPVLPEIAGRVIALANDAHTAIEDLCKLIEQDQALAANVLRYANSPAFAVGEPVFSLHEAMMRMGMTMVSGIAVAACLDGEAFHAPRFDGYRRRVRAHALLTAGVARDLGRRKRCNVDTVFMCALMHTIGKPVVLRLLTEVQKRENVTISEPEAIELAEEYEVSAARSAVAAWNLPRHVQVAAVYYHDPATAPEFGRETTVTALASRLAFWISEDDPSGESRLRAQPEWGMLGIDGDEVDATIERARRLRFSPAETF